MLSYKTKIIPTLSIFFQHKNDIDFFIEDSNDEEFYKALFQNLFEEKRIGKIQSCGCRTKLIDACKNDQIDSKRKRFYISDGDLDLIFKEDEVNLKNLIILDRYCIENYLLEEESVIEIIHDSIVLEKSKIKNQLGFENWFKAISKPLIDLFLHYAISQKHAVGEQTTSYGVLRLCKQSHGVNVLDADRVNDRIKVLKTAIINKIGEDLYLEELYQFSSKWPITTETLLKIVSAKDYLIPLFTHRCKKLRGKSSYNVTQESLRLRLAKLNNFESLLWFKKIVLS